MNLDSIVSEVLHLSSEILAFLSLYTIYISVIPVIYYMTLPLMELLKPLYEMDMISKCS